MLKELTCIECPKSCKIRVEMEADKITKIEGYSCPKGEIYARAEIENPLRILTSAVLAEGLSLKMVPVRTDKPIPKTELLKAMEEVKKIRINHPVKVGDTIKNIFIQDVNLIATKDIS